MLYAAMLIGTNAAYAGGHPCHLGRPDRVLGDNMLRFADDGVSLDDDRGTKVMSFFATIESGVASLTLSIDSPYKPDLAALTRESVIVTFHDSAGGGVVLPVLRDVPIGSSPKSRLVIALGIDADLGARLSQRGVSGVEITTEEQRWTIPFWGHASKMLEDIGACAEMRSAKLP
jgi:hypothetical protein